jgi:repressor LexA
VPLAQAALILSSRVSVRKLPEVTQEYEYVDSNAVVARDDHDHRLTPRRQKILNCIHDSVERRGYPPSMREIADAVGLKSTSAVSYQLKILEHMGHLTRDARMPRTVVEKPPYPRVQHEAEEAATGSPAMVSVPLFEQIAAGAPVVANPYPEGTMHLPEEMTGSGALFAVRVAGDSMAGANIFDGDCVIVRQQDTARNGDIVAALIQDEATVKTFHRADGHVWLMPQNPGYQPILGDQCGLMGKVVATVHRI